MEVGVCLTCNAEEVEVDDDGKCEACNSEEKGHDDHDEEPAE